MKNTIKGLGWDTAVVLFLLALECGRAVQLFSIEGSLMTVVIVMMATLPYFLLPVAEVGFRTWLFGRAAIAVVGIAAGTMLPASMEYMPMTLLIVMGPVSCYLQFYGLMRLRPVK